MGTKPRLSIGVYQNPRGGRTKESIKKYTDGISGKNRKYRTEISDRGKVRKIELKGGGMSSGQAAIAAKAPPPNKIDAKDFAVLRSEKAKGRGMGLQDEKVQPGKVMKANLGTMATKLISKFMGNKKSASSGSSNMASSGKGMSGMLPKLLQKAIDDGTIKTAKHGKMIKARVGKSVTRIPLAGKSTSVGSTTMKGMKFSDKAKMVDAGKINKATGKFTSMEALRESIGYRPGETSEKFNKRKTAMAAAKKAARASRIGKIAFGVGAAGVAASEYLKSKMKKNKNQKMLKDYREQKKPGIPSGKTQDINTALNILNKNKKMGGGMMQRPMGYKDGTKPGAGPMSKMGKAGRAMQARRTQAGPSQTPKERKEKPALVVQFGVPEGPAKQNTTIKTVKIKNRDELKKTLSSRMSGGMMQRPMGYSEGMGPRAGRSMDPDMDRRKKSKSKDVADLSGKRKDKYKVLSKTRVVLRSGKEKPVRKTPIISRSETSSRQPDGTYKTTQFSAKAYNKNNSTEPTKFKDIDSRHYGLKSGGMMKPMGYRSGTMVKARGCKLGRTRPTKIT